MVVITPNLKNIAMLFIVGYYQLLTLKLGAQNLKPVSCVHSGSEWGNTDSDRWSF